MYSELARNKCCELFERKHPRQMLICRRGILFDVEGAGRRRRRRISQVKWSMAGC